MHSVRLISVNQPRALNTFCIIKCVGSCVCVFTPLHHGTGLVEECGQAVVDGTLLGNLQSDD